MTQDLFQGYSTCSQVHFAHPEYARLVASIALGTNYHRKPWEWVFIMHHLYSSGVVGPGARGLGFGVGSEPLTAVFAEAGAAVCATDAPVEVGEAGGWTIGDQYARGLSAIPRGQLSPEEFDRLVSFSFCDMNDIEPGLKEFDFCWSSCALEHLGTLRAGIDFIINSVEKTLRVGGVAVHTTEYNVDSNDETLESGWTVIYRQRDIEELVSELRERGHEVEEFRPTPNMGEIDRHVDIPPYNHDPHLRLLLEGFVSTSCGLVIRRGPM